VQACGNGEQKKIMKREVLLTDEPPKRYGRFNFAAAAKYHHHSPHIENSKRKHDAKNSKQQSNCDDGDQNTTNATTSELIVA